MIKLLEPEDFSNIKVTWINGEPELWKVMDAIIKKVVDDNKALETKLKMIFSTQKKYTIREFLEEYSSQCVLMFGAYRNYTLNRVIKIDPGYFEYLLKESRFKKSLRGFLLLSENSFYFTYKKVVNL
jgi:hypothetical protein